MNRQPSACDFCGSSDPLIPYDEPGFCWYACPQCTHLIENEEWQGLVARCREAYRMSDGFSGDDKRLLEDEAETLVRTFKECLLIRVS
jgi:hypothetical protein